MTECINVELHCSHQFVYIYVIFIVELYMLVYILQYLYTLFRLILLIFQNLALT